MKAVLAVPAALALLAASTGLTGCAREGGSATSPGSAETAVNTAALKPGGFPTTPAAALGTAGSEDAGRLAEGRRLADYVTGPWEADPSLTVGGQSTVRIIAEEKDLGTVLWPALVAPAHRGSVIAGFSTERQAVNDGDATMLRNTVLRYADGGTAAEAAVGITSAAMRVPLEPNSSTPVEKEPTRSISVPGHPGLTGALMTSVSGTDTIRELTVASAHGPYLMIQVARSAQGAEAAAAFVGRTLDLQVPLLDGFRPTDPAELSEIPLDPTGLVAETLLQTSHPEATANATYQPRGALHLDDAPVATAAALTAAGVDLVSVGLTTVYRAENADKAHDLAGQLAAELTGRASTQTDPGVSGLPESVCAAMTGPLTRHRCVVSVGRYVISASSRQLPTAHQETAAQYLLLAG